MSDSKQGKILVIRGGAIGDFVLTLPVLAALRSSFPVARIEVLGYSHIAQLALAGRLADRVRSIEARPLAGFFARGGPLAPELADYFDGFSIILSYLYDPDQIFQTNVARCSSAQFIAGAHRPDETAGLHASKVFLQALERLAIFDADPVPRLRLERDLLFAPEAAHGCRRLALHPGSGSEKKNWPEGKWRELIERLLADTDWNLLLVGGEAEGASLERLHAAIPSERGELIRNRSLVELAGRLNGCRAFVGHDSGISHLSAALGLPGVVLWGETIERVWRPPNESVAVLRPPGGLAAIRPAEVITQVGKLMDMEIADG